MFYVQQFLDVMFFLKLSEQFKEIAYRYDCGLTPRYFKSLKVFVAAST